MDFNENYYENVFEKNFQMVYQTGVCFKTIHTININEQKKPQCHTFIVGNFF